MSDYPIVVLPLPPEDGGGYLGFAPDLPGCVSDGHTPEEAVSNTILAIGEWLDTQSGRGVEAPVPGDAARHAQDREDKLLDAIRSLADYRESADQKIRDLERKLTELIAVLKDDSGHRPLALGVPPKLEVGKIRRPN